MSHRASRSGESPSTSLPKSTATGKPRSPIEEIHRVRAGLDGGDLVFLTPQLVETRHHVGARLPLDVVLGSQRGLADFAMRWPAGDARETHPFETHRVSSPEEGADVVEAAHVVQNHPYRQCPDVSVRLRQLRRGKWKTLNGVSHQGTSIETDTRPS